LRTIYFDRAFIRTRSKLISPIQGREPYPTNFTAECWNHLSFSWDHSHLNSQSNCFYTEPSAPSWRIHNECKEPKSTLEESLEALKEFENQVASFQQFTAQFKKIQFSGLRLYR